MNAFKKLKNKVYKRSAKEEQSTPKSNESLKIEEVAVEDDELLLVETSAASSPTSKSSPALKAAPSVAAIPAPKAMTATPPEGPAPKKMVKLPPGVKMINKLPMQGFSISGDSASVPQLIKGSIPGSSMGTVRSMNSRTDAPSFSFTKVADAPVKRIVAKKLIASPGNSQGDLLRQTISRNSLVDFQFAENSPEASNSNIFKPSPGVGMKKLISKKIIVPSANVTPVNFKTAEEPKISLNKTMPMKKMIFPPRQLNAGEMVDFGSKKIIRMPQKAPVDQPAITQSIPASAKNSENQSLALSLSSSNQSIRLPSEHSTTLIAASENPPPPTAMPIPKADVKEPLPESRGKTESNRLPNAMPLTKENRRRAIEQLSFVLSPHQYYGKIVKLTNIHVFFPPKRHITDAKRSSSSIYVASKSTDASTKYFTQLHLLDSDAVPVKGTTKDGLVETVILLHEANPGRMAFSSTPLEAKHLMESYQARSCYVSSSASIVFREPEKDVFPVAQLTIRWFPYSSPGSEPSCPIHHKEMQLFDPYSRTLVCALCASKDPSSLGRLVVIPDVLNPVSRNSMVESLHRQQKDSQKMLKMWVDQHKHVVRMALNKKNAIDQQFDLLISAIETQRKEFLDACDTEFDGFLDGIAKEVIAATQKIEVLSAAAYHLESQKTLHALQIATIAEGLEASKTISSALSNEMFKFPRLWSSTMPNLEKLMRDVHALVPYKKEASNFDKQLVVYADPATKSSALPSEASDRHPSIVRCGEDQRGSEGEESDATRKSKRHSHSMKRSNSSKKQQSLSPKRAPKIPTASGSAIFDCPLHELILHSSNDGKHQANGPSKQKVVQWAVRIKDPGEWVGIGVAVGKTRDAYIDRSVSNDLSHLWIPPLTASKNEVYWLRASFHNGLAKLSIHDKRGKRIDNGRIPQWNAQRPSYPQATFGGKPGIVELVEQPHVVECRIN